MRYRHFILILFAGPLLAACANAQPAPASVGKPKQCLALSSIRAMTIVDDKTLLFEIPGHKYYVNKLPHRCAGIDFGDPILYRSRIGSLCNLDMVTVLIPIGGGFQLGPRCGLAMFEPVTPDEAKKLKQKH